MNEMHPPKHETKERKKETNRTTYFVRGGEAKFKVQDNEVLQKIR